MICNLGDPMSLRHPISIQLYAIWEIQLYTSMWQYDISSWTYPVRYTRLHKYTTQRLKYHLFYRALLQKWPIILRSLPIEVTHTYYGVTSVRRLLKIIGHFCKRAFWNRRYCAKETYNFKEPTIRSHPHTSVYTTVWLRLIGSLKLKTLLQSIVTFIGFFCKRDI